MCTDFQKKIYNEHLRISKIVKNKPFRLRKNFDDLSDSNKYFLSKIELLFCSSPYIEIESFFKAPYEIYSKDEYFDLKFYTTQKAISVYSLYMKRLMESHPDEILDRIVSGIKFIDKYCKEKNITLEQFAEENTGLYPTFIYHLKNFNYPLYIIFYIPNAFKNFTKIPIDDRKFLLSDNFYENIDSLRRKVNHSVNAHRLLTLWVSKKQQNKQ